jgi:hypothetical protein
LTATLAAQLVIADQPGDAADAIAEVVDIAPAIGFTASLAWAIEALALLRARDGDAAVAARLAGYAGTILPSPATRAGARRAVFAELNATLARLLPADGLDSLKLQGAGWTEATAVSASWSALAACEAA